MLLNAAKSNNYNFTDETNKISFYYHNFQVNQLIRTLCKYFNLLKMSTPVSALQEYAVKKKYTMPQYNTEPSDVLGYAFKCTVHVDKIIGIGYGSTKQSAKHQSATKALEQFGIGSKINDGNNNALKIASFSVPEPPRANTNYVGVLNELASTRGKPYPVYEDVQSLGPFKIQCSFLTWQTEGTGTQKKAAKQEAAQKMLQL